MKVGIGTRVMNFLVDTLLVFGISEGIFSIYKFYVLYYHILYFPFYYFFWATLFLYYLFCEAIWKRTPGKYLSITKVATIDGGKPGFGQILIRSLIRLTVIDCFFFPFLDNTLHDYLSKTVVVEN